MRFSFLLSLILSSAFTALAHEHDRPLEFIKNKNQWNAQVAFKCDLQGGSVYLESSTLTYSFLDPAGVDEMHDLQFASDEERASFLLHGHAWKVHFVGGQRPEISGKNQNTQYYNYFIGNDQSTWSSKVPSFETVDYIGIYEGIDMKFTGHEANLKYDFIVSSGADPDRIRLEYEGLESLHLEDGNLSLRTSIGSFIESRPYAYQVIGGQQKEVACEYSLEGNEVGFIFPEGYDHDLPLIIDPELIAATLSGTSGGSSNYGHCAAFDLEGNIYTGCVAGGSQYPVTTGAFDQTYGGGTWDIGISKLTPDGTELLWATFIGGVNSDYPHSMVTNDALELYVYGSTSSPDFPTTNSAYQTSFGGDNDIIITHLNADGSALIGSTFLGGSESDGRNEVSLNYGDSYRGEIMIDYDNDPMIVSSSSSSDFPVLLNAYQSTIGGEQDAVLVKLNPTLSSLSISTFIGGPGNDVGFGIRSATDGSIYICGGAESDFPVTSGVYQMEFLGGSGWSGEFDAFIAKFNSSGTDLLASTYFGTDETDQAFFIDLDFDESVWVFGQGGSEIPVVGDVYSSPQGKLFISQFNSNLSELLVSTTLGDAGSSSVVPDAFLVDNCDNIYISGYSAFGDALEATDDALFGNSEGGFYLAVFEEDLADIVFGTFYTGNHVDGGTSRFDKNGIVYQAVCSGGGFSTTADAWATDQNTGWDIGVFKINFDASGVNAAVAANDISGCAPFEITFQNFSVGDQFLWDFGDGTTSDEYAPTYIYDEPGVYTVSLIASDSLSCNLADTVYFDISISTPQDFTPSFNYEVDCANQTVISNNTTDLDFLEYVWDMGDGTVLEDYDIVYEYAEPGDYTVTLTAVDNGCDADEAIMVDITIEPSVTAEANTSSLEACNELEATFENNSLNATSFSWDFGDGSTSNETEPTHTFIGPASFEVILTASNPDACNVSDSDTLMITVGADQVLESIFDLFQTDCEFFTVQTDNQSIGENITCSWDMGDGTVLQGTDVSHDYNTEGSFTVTLTVSDDLCDISAESSETITVTSEAVAVIGNGDITGCTPLSVEFQSMGAGSATWDFGDGSPTVSGSAVSHTYTTEGNFTVTLSIIGEGSCFGSDETTSMVEVLPPPLLIPDFTAIPTGDCEDLEVLLTNESQGDIDSYTWDLGDGTTSGAVDVEHIYSSTGTYDITLSAYNEVCDMSAAMTIPLELEGIPDLPEPPLARICPKIGTVEIDAGIEDAEYLWFNDETTQAISVTDEGTYTVQVNISGCWFPRDISVEQVEELYLSKIVTLCETGSNFLIIEGPAIASYHWDTGDETAITYIDESGVYPFSVIDIYGCIHYGEMDATLLPKDPLIFIPNAFSPNGDGVNDYFLPVADDLEEYELVVHNRWGDLIFQTKDKNQVWNGGEQNGEPYYVPDGVYTYTITYRSACSTERIVDSGTVTVLR